MQEAIPMLVGRPRPVKLSIVERFNRKWIIERNSACHIWSACVDSRGYGNIGMSRNGGSVTVMAHRLSWEIANGPIPRGLYICHHCDNKKCVNPKHLFLGTAADNNRDCATKGRTNKPKGENCSAAKLTDADVLAIRTSNGTQVEVGKKYGVNGSQIWRIRNRRTWRHVLP